MILNLHSYIQNLDHHYQLSSLAIPDTPPRNPVGETLIWTILREENFISLLGIESRTSCRPVPSHADVPARFCTVSIILVE
jgi:hypothetical protein